MKFCPLIALLWLNLLNFNQYKGNNSCTTDAILTKLDVRQRNMVIYIYIKFHQIPLIGYFVMAPDGHDGRTDMEKTISARLRRVITNFRCYLGLLSHHLEFKL